jgi:hypothetical protein
MNLYFKITGWLYLIMGVVSGVLTVYFQLNDRKDEATFTLISLFICGIMLGIRLWQKKRLEKLDEYLKEKNQKKK